MKIKSIKNYNFLFFIFFVFMFLSLFFIIPNSLLLANEEEIEKLEDKIDEHKGKIEELDKQIEVERQKVSKTAAEAYSLEQKIKELENTKTRLNTSIKQTQEKIKTSQLTLEKLTLEINNKKDSIGINKSALEKALRTSDILENKTIIETFLGYETFSSFWNELVNLSTFERKLEDKIKELNSLTTELSGKYKEEDKEKKDLENNQKVLTGEQEVIEATKEQQDELLGVTKSKEEAYRSALQQKIAAREEFENSLRDFESQLQTLIDPDSYPAPRQGILDWPLDTIIITQSFGGTEFAKTNPHVYGRAFHNGSDFGIPVGTRIKTVSSGKVKATGNTDAYPGCLSWGKWVLVEHNNGLSTLYAHLSSILVDPGENLDSGDIVGLSGNTGYSTGPHLHLTLYATQGVEVVKFNQFKKGSTGCSATGASTPVAPLDAYLDPMQYLPKL